MKVRWPWRCKPSDAVRAYQQTLLKPEALQRAHAAYKEAAGFFYKDSRGLRHESTPGRVFTSEEAAMVSLKAAIQALLGVSRT